MTQRRRHPDSDAPNEVARTGRVRLSRALLSLTLLAVGACDGQIGDPPASGPGPDGRRPGDPVELRIEPRVWRLSPAHFQSELHRLFGEDVPTVTLPPGAPENASPTSPRRAAWTSATRAPSSKARAPWACG